MGINMNLRILKGTNRSPAIGDCFTMMPPDGQFLFGRVIEIDANPLGLGGGILIYIYNGRSESKQVLPDMTVSNLLLPPIITNKQPWIKGYFEFLGNVSLGPKDRLAVHCFKDSRGWYFNERGTRLQVKTEPVGEWGLHSYRTIDDAISNALGIPQSQEK